MSILHFAELVCPLTLNVFLDPVLTSAGHSYEKKAIEEFLCRANIDPLTREPLESKSLTPVYVLRSRALEYREKTSRRCIDKACSLLEEKQDGVPVDPVRYLRRAVELVAETEHFPLGLTRETVDYVLSHPSNAYDNLVMKKFAHDLYQKGYKDKAAIVYFNLLCCEADRQRQADLLNKCLECWQNTKHAVENVSNDLECQFDEHSLYRLAGLIQSKTWIIDVASLAGLGHAGVAKLCEMMLFPLHYSTSSGSLIESSKIAKRGEQVESLSWSEEKSVLMKYVRTSFHATEERLSRLEKSISTIEKDVCVQHWRNRKLIDVQNNREIGDEGMTGLLGFVSTALHSPIVLLPACLVVVFGDGRRPQVKLCQILPFLSILSSKK